MALSQELQQHVMDALSKNETFLKANQADQVEIARGAMQHMEESQSSAWRSPGPHTMPNEKNESFVGSQTPRSVGDAVPGMVKGGVDMYGRGEPAMRACTLANIAAALSITEEGPSTAPSLDRVLAELARAAN